MSHKAGLAALAVSVVVLLAACSSTNRPPGPPLPPEPVSMLTAGGCYQAACRHDKAALVMCVSSEDTTEPPLRIDVFWPHDGVERARTFESRRAFDEDAVRLVVPLELDCNRREYRIELSAVSRSTRLSDSIASECSEPLERCGRP